MTTFPSRADSSSRAASACRTGQWSLERAPPATVRSTSRPAWSGWLPLRRADGFPEISSDQHEDMARVFPHRTPADFPGQRETWRRWSWGLGRLPARSMRKQLHLRTAHEVWT